MGCLVALFLYLKSVCAPPEDLGSNASIESTSLPPSSPLILADLQGVERQVILLHQLQARWLSDPAQYIQRPIANTWNVHFNNVGNVSHCKVESFEDHSENQYKGVEGPRR
ncbi:hypothetical protein BJ165DRAFT_1519826 [Panaeolus papilionaceus]|nr:hypothetical protein BJ165DRAFT_1519826 [Panaeolus papilionaceus]